VMLVPDVCTTLRFSTAGMPEPARAQAVRDLHLHERTFLSAKLEPIEPLEPLPDYPLHVDLTKRTLPGLAVVSGKLSGLRHAIRPSGVAANANDDLLLGVNVRGRSIASQRGRDLILRDGDAFFATRDVTEIIITRPTPVRFIGCRVPRVQVALLLGRLDDTPMHLVPHRTEPLDLLVSYASAIVDALPLTTPELQRLAICHMHDLIAATIRAARGGRAIAEGRGIAAARLQAIMTEICSHLGDGDLSVSKIARHHRVTPRYIHKLFENEGLTFSSFVLGQRLSHAHRILSDPHLADRNICSVAFDAGFGDLSYFNRTFRQRYAATPTEIRQSAMRADPPRR
jgi:AraC-like DNA-binding protein